MDRVPPTRRTPGHVLSAMAAMAAHLFTPEHLPKHRREGKHAERKRKLRGESGATAVKPRSLSDVDAMAVNVRHANAAANISQPAHHRLCTNLKKLRHRMRMELKHQAARELEMAA